MVINFRDNFSCKRIQGRGGGSSNASLMMPTLPKLVILAIVLFFLLLVSYPWYTLTASVIGYLLFLPFSVLAYSRRAKLEGEAELPPDVDARSGE